ncbi:major capsid protein [Enterococcus cecorum]|uniref:major capsid protein n=1 Tax=Enterococcus cecorum TaxID=44008 RepID=UPI001FAD2337|nr:major capsid protein [Enterococcus cecorum]MCJ0591227.1 major capsid protein [Enterococcus cecorum]
MADELTKVVDVITPQLYTDYMNIFTKEKSALLLSGAAVSDSTVSENISAGGLLVNMPMWNDLNGEDEVIDDGEKGLTTGKIVASADIAAVMYRGKGWSVNELAGQIAGSDPLQALMTKIGTYWLRREQQVFISVLNGLFAAADSGASTPAGPLNKTHLLDKKGSNIDKYTILDAKQLLGDAADQLSLIVMHSAIYTSLQKLELIDYIQPSQGGQRIPTYQGYRVVVDDGVPSYGSGATKYYTTYLFAEGSIGRNTGTPGRLTMFETARDAAKGNNNIFTRRAFTMHPYGVKFTNVDRESGFITPTNKDLANPKNWAKVYEDKNIGIVALWCKPLA